MKQIQVCLDRHFQHKKPLKAKWQVREHPEQQDILLLFHYQHLILVYDLKEEQILKEWWELNADRRGLESAREYFKRRKEQRK